MTILFMETDVAKQTQAKMVSTQQEFANHLVDMNAAISNLQQNWLGNSATQFNDEYSEWSNALRSFLEELSKMSERLQNEINEWEATAQKFG